MEGNFTGENSVPNQLNAIAERLDDIDGESGLIATSLATAKEYTDTRETAITTTITAAYEAYADQAKTDAVSTANEYTDGKVTTLEAKDTELTNAISANTTAISTETERADTAEKALGTRIDNVITAYEAADNAINAKFGADYSAASTVASAIADAKKAGTDAATAVDTLSKGQVTTNANNISANAKAIADEITARSTADAGLNDRLVAVEAFFEGAAKDEGEGENLKNALDKLVEIQTYITNDGKAAADMLDAIDANAEAITALQNIVNDGGTLEVRVDAAETAITRIDDEIDAHDTKIGTLETFKTAYEDRFGTADDILILNCGTATTII